MDLGHRAITTGSLDLISGTRGPVFPSFLSVPSPGAHPGLTDRKEAWASGAAHLPLQVRAELRLGGKLWTATEGRSA